MMKRLSLKGLRLSSHPKDTVQSGDDVDEVADYEQPPRPLSAEQEDIEGFSPEITKLASDEPGTPKKREKKGFFKTLKRKLTGNFKGKRDSVTGAVVVIEDDSSSETRDDGSLQCTRAFHSPRRPRHHHPDLPPATGAPPAAPAHPGGCTTSSHTTTTNQLDPQKHAEKHLRQPTKEEVSKSEEESSTPTEEEKVQTVFLTDAEYGHTSAPFSAPTSTSSTTKDSSDNVVTSLTTTTSERSEPTQGPVTPEVIVSKAQVEAGSETLVTLPDLTWPVAPAPPRPPKAKPEAECGATVSGSDSETQGACAPRADFSDHDDSDLPPMRPPPPPPTASTSAQPDGYEPYDPSEQGCRSHLALIGGGTTDPAKLLPVYDQLKEPPKSWSLTKELFKLSKFGWYWGPITRVEAEEKLLNQTDGAFLVRDSSDERYLLSLSFRSYGRTLHTRIEHCNGVFSFYAQPESEGYYSIVDLIEHSMTDSQTGVFCYSRARTPGSPSFPVRLTKPVSRFTQVRSLQYLCRFVIRQYTRFDHIQKLPLPPRIKGWLEENQY